MNQKQAKRIRRMAAAVAQNAGDQLSPEGYMRNRNTGSIVVDPKSLHGLIKGLKKNLQGKVMTVQGKKPAQSGRVYPAKLATPDQHPAPAVYADQAHKSVI